MKLVKTSIVAATLLASAAATAVEVEGNVTLATDYVFRGYSQTSEKGAIQGGFDIGFESGFYLGTWASNVDFGSEVTTEMDFYVGYAFDISDSLNLDLTAIQFVYPGDESALNYEEYVATLGFGDFSVGLVYSPEYFGATDQSAYVLNLDYSLGLSDVSSIDFHVGSTTTEDDGLVDEDDGYIDYMVGFNYDVAGVTLTLAWYGTDVDAESDYSDDRAVFSISKSL